VKGTLRSIQYTWTLEEGAGTGPGSAGPQHQPNMHNYKSNEIYHLA